MADSAPISPKTSTRKDSKGSKTPVIPLDVIEMETNNFKQKYEWLVTNMPNKFTDVVSREALFTIAHHLIIFEKMGDFSHISFKGFAICVTLDTIDADVEILKYYGNRGITSYRTFVSKSNLQGFDKPVRIARIGFTVLSNGDATQYPKLDKLKTAVKARLATQNMAGIADTDLDATIGCVDSSFARALNFDKLVMALSLYFRARDTDHCQYEIYRNNDWAETGDSSIEVVFAWRNTPKVMFLYRVSTLMRRNDLMMNSVNTTWVVDPTTKENILIMYIALHGKNNKAAWDVCAWKDFLMELITLKYSRFLDNFHETLVKPGHVSGNMGTFLRAVLNFVHQVLVDVDYNMFAFNNVSEALCRYPEITVKLCQAFEYKFNPAKVDLEKYKQTIADLKAQLKALDTGRPINDHRRRTILIQAVNMVEHILKTNFYTMHRLGLSFRLDPKYLDFAPFDRKKKYPELPYAVFYIRGLHFFGYHIRFRDIARGGMRTLITSDMEAKEAERANMFSECYNLAYTQQKKNKDIPEGGAKCILFLGPNEELNDEINIMKKDLEAAGVEAAAIDKQIDEYKKAQTREFLYSAQRSFVTSLLTLVNSDDDGKLRADNIIDYYGKPEYLYLGPDENMHNNMIDWIAAHSKKYNYKVGGCFISGKQDIGFNHKAYGVTSRGVYCYVKKVLQHLGIAPDQPFTVKISGGPDGDVAGNFILNLQQYCPKTAKLLVITDGSGTIYDPQGLDLKVLCDMFVKVQPVSKYPPQLLHEGGFLLDINTRREEKSYLRETLCWRMTNGALVQDWLSGSAAQQLYRSNAHRMKTDIFMPGGGRPRTLHADNWKEFLDESGKPTSKAIVEGANLYLTAESRTALEDAGVIIIKDSSANKCGVITSSYEILCGLALNDDQFLKEKETLIGEILSILEERATAEADLMLQHHAKTGERLTIISEKISERINMFADTLQDYFRGITLPTDVNHPLVKCFLKYCPKTLAAKYSNQLIERVPDSHKKAIIACSLSASVVYTKGLDWAPTIVDILSLLLKDENYFKEN